MTIIEFRKLRELKQLNAVRNRGVFLAERCDHKSKYVLYQLDAFYIEFIYDLDEPSLREMEIFGGTALLEPYLDDIRIPALF